MSTDESQIDPNVANSISSVRFDVEMEDLQLDDPSPFVQPIYRSYRLAEVIPGNTWPDNLQQLIRDPTACGYDAQSPKKISLAEVTALLCHAALVEIGFIPENANMSFPVAELFNMPDSERIRCFGRRVDEKGYNSSAAVFSWRYQVVTVASDKQTNQGTLEISSELMTKMDKDLDKTPSLYPSGTSVTELVDNAGEKVARYELSSPCDIIMVPKDSTLQVFCNFHGSESTKPFQLNVMVDIRSSMQNNTPGMESLKQSGDEWMRIMNLNGLGFSSAFKRNFATLCLDAMNGIMFDLRSLVCLPPEILIQIYTRCDIKMIRNMRLTCRYLHEVAKIPGLWRTLIKRDFGATPSVPAARFARFFSRVPYELSPHIIDAPRDYRAIFEAHRRINVRPRFDALGGMANNRLAPRHSWFYVTPPRPYLLRLSYDVSSPHSTIPSGSSRQYIHPF